MTNVADRYITREFLKLFLLVLAVFIMIYVLVDVFEKVDNFVEAGMSSQVITRYFLYKIPQIIWQVEPVAILIAGLLTISLLLKSNEMLAMKSMGRSLLVICRPIFLLSLLLSLFLFEITENVLPVTTARTNYIWDVQVKKRRPRGFFGKDKFWFKGENVIYSIGSLQDGNRLLKDVEIFIFDKQFNPREIIYARDAFWAGDCWQVRDGKSKIFESTGCRILSFKERKVALSENPLDFSEMSRSTSEMSSEQLSRLIGKLEYQGQDIKAYAVDYQARFAYAFMGPVLLILGIPALLWQRVKSSIALGITVGIFIVFSIWTIWQFSLTLGRTGHFSPYLAAWSPLFLAGMSGVIIWRKIWQ